MLGVTYSVCWEPPSSRISQLCMPTRSIYHFSRILSRSVVTVGGPLVSFECVEWHPVDRVVRQYGYAQSPLLPAQHIPLDQHCYTLRGVQCHDWSTILADWIQQWGNHRNSRLRDRNLQPIADFSPSADYRHWYIDSFWMYLRLSEYIPQQPPQHPPQQPPQHPPQQPYAVFHLFLYHRPWTTHIFRESISFK
ncbi:hypothetical protein AHAS_Ahas15G0265300 [Arachis hypogaea]